MRKHVVLAQPGGIYTPQELKNIVQLVKKGSIEGLHLGERQELIFAPHYSAKAHNEKALQKLSCWSLQRDEFNPICSQVAGGLADAGVLDWAYEEDAYREILDGIRKPLPFRVGMLHPKQKLLPQCTNDLNFYPSEELGFWYLLLNFKAEMVLLPRLIPTDSVLRWIELTEKAISDGLATDALPFLLCEELSEDWPEAKALNFPSFPHEDLEGFLEMSSGRLALNLYNNHHPWSLTFVEELMDLAQSRDIAQVYVTTGRSLLIKHIKASERLLWEGLLSRHSMTLRHSGSDLAWIVGSHKAKNVRLKRRLQRHLDREGITFSHTYISIDPPRIDDRASLFIRTTPRWFGDRYELLYKKDFRPLSDVCVSVGRDLSFAELKEKLMEVHRLLYERMVEEQGLKVEPLKHRSDKVTRYECSECLSCYDVAYGDPARGILESTAFEDLPGHWNCELCEAPKEAFRPAAVIS